MSSHYHTLEYNVEVPNSSMSLDVWIFASFIFHNIDNRQIRYKNILITSTSVLWNMKCFTKSIIFFYLSSVIISHICSLDWRKWRIVSGFTSVFVSTTGSIVDKNLIVLIMTSKGWAINLQAPPFLWQVMTKHTYKSGALDIKEKIYLSAGWLY